VVVTVSGELATDAGGNESGDVRNVHINFAPTLLVILPMRQLIARGLMRRR